MNNRPENEPTKVMWIGSQKGKKDLISSNSCVHTANRCKGLNPTPYLGSKNLETFNSKFSGKKSLIDYS